MTATYPGLGLLCTQDELQRERRGYFDAFSKLTRVRLLDRYDEDLDSAARRFKADLGEGPVVLLYPDNARSYSPCGLTDLPWLTACFQIDSFSTPERRASWSRLFDAVFVFHPQSVQEFAKHGNPQVHLAPHGVRAEYFAAAPEAGRRLDIGFVGNLQLRTFRLRRSILGELEKRGYAMNDFRRSYDYAELAAVYRSSRIGVNIPQDNYQRDANLRAFEVMAGGALLITPRPSELTELGFREGEHFVAFRDPPELIAHVDHYLENDAERERIAAAGRQRTLAGFTYDVRAREILQVLRNLAAGAQRFRETSPGEVARVYLRHHASQGQAVQMRRYATVLKSLGKMGLADRRAAWAGELRRVKRWLTS